MELEQYVCLATACVSVGCPWVAVLTLLQFVCGERADCMRQARVGWLRHMDPHDEILATVRIE